MVETDLRKIEKRIKKEKIDMFAVKEMIGEYAINDIAAFVEKEKRLPGAADLILQYREIPDFENVLGLVDLDVKQIEKFLGVLLKYSDVDDFKIVEPEKVK